MPSVVRLPLAVQTPYAELLRSRLYDAADGPTLDAGSLVTKVINEQLDAEVRAALGAHGVR